MPEIGVEFIGQPDPGNGGSGFVPALNVPPQQPIDAPQPNYNFESVDHDPFASPSYAEPQQYWMAPVDHDPFATTPDRKFPATSVSDRLRNYDATVLGVPLTGPVPRAIRRGVAEAIDNPRHAAEAVGNFVFGSPMHNPETGQWENGPGSGLAVDTAKSLGSYLGKFGQLSEPNTVQLDQPGQLSEDDVQRMREASAKRAEQGIKLGGESMMWGMGLGGLKLGAPEGSAGIFGGPMAKSADLAALAKAKELSRLNVTPQKILAETGWHNFHGNHWAFEIPEDGSQFRPEVLKQAEKTGTPVTMADVFHNPKVYEAYPQLGDIKVETFGPDDPGASHGARAYYKESTNTIHLRDDLTKPEMATAIRGLLSHEGQHPIQGIEGWPTGGSPRSPEVVARAESDMQKAAAEAEHKEASIVDTREHFIAKNLGIETLTPAEMARRRELLYQDSWNRETRSEYFGLTEKLARMKEAIRVADPSTKERLEGEFWRQHPGLEQDYEQATNVLYGESAKEVREQKLYQAYRDLVGEGQARLSSERAYMTPEQRAETYPRLPIERGREIARYRQSGAQHNEEAPPQAGQSPSAASANSERGRIPRRNRSLEQAQRAAKDAAESAPKLQGLPDEAVRFPKLGLYVPGPIGKAHRAAEDYMASKGLPYNPPKTYQPVDKARAWRIAQEFDRMEHAPNDPRVKASYNAMINETLDQLKAIQKTGLKIEFIKPGQRDPYANNPRLAVKDVADNNHLWVFPTEGGFGSTKVDTAEHPMLRPTNVIVDGRKLVANDVFRIVHDYFGHVKDGVGFRASGEENAWRSHSAMYSDLARPAMTTETRGQNSWVNYGPHGEKNRTAKSADTEYAQQKTGLMPDWVSNEGRGDPGGTSLYSNAPDQTGGVAPVFFSALEQHIEKMAPKQAPAAQWLGIIQNAIQKGVKPEEIKWSQVEDWLKDRMPKPGANRAEPVAKQDLLDYIRAHTPEVKYIQRGPVVTNTGKRIERVEHWEGEGGTYTQDQIDDKIAEAREEHIDEKAKELAETNLTQRLEELGPITEPKEAVTVEQQHNGRWTYSVDFGENQTERAIHGPAFESKDAAERHGLRHAEDIYDHNVESWREARGVDLRREIEDEARQEVERDMDHGRDSEWEDKENEIRDEHPLNFEDWKDEHLSSRDQDRIDEHVNEAISERVSEWASQEAYGEARQHPKPELVERQDGWYYRLKDEDDEMQEHGPFESETEADREGDNDWDNVVERKQENLYESYTEDGYNNNSLAGIDADDIRSLTNDALSNLGHSYQIPRGRRTYQEREVEHTTKTGGPKFENYMSRAPGGENYREAVITLPSLEGNYQPPSLHRYGDEPSLNTNRVAHVFSEDRTFDGGKYENIVELQSDLHHYGYEGGYRNKAEANKLTQEINDNLLNREKENHAISQLIAQRETGRWDDSLAQALHNASVRKDKLVKEHISLTERYNKADIGAVPDAPFKASWPMLAMKQKIREAVEAGKDGISWDSGRTVAQRYSASTFIKELQWDKNPDGTYSFHARGRGAGRDVSQANLTKEKFSETLGKEIAQKIFDAPESTGTMQPTDLELGGEFHKKLYDKDMVRDINKLVKQFGTSVEDRVQNGRTYHILKFTPELKNIATERGFSLYANKGGSPLYRMVPVNHDPFANEQNDRKNSQRYRQGGLPRLEAPSGDLGLLSISGR